MTLWLFRKINNNVLINMSVKKFRKEYERSFARYIIIYKKK